LGYFKVYDNPTTANEPNLRMNSFQIVSNLKEPSIGDFIIYNYNDNLLGEHTRVHRLCAFENDTIELRNGTLFINNINFDENLNLVQLYKINKFDFDQLNEDKIINESVFGTQIHKDTFLIGIEKVIAKKYKLESKRFVSPKSNINKSIQEIYNEDWTLNDFGALVIPKNKIFVIGDNRDYSDDSRLIGLIDKNAIVGTILNK